MKTLSKPHFIVICIVAICLVFTLGWIASGRYHNTSTISLAQRSATSCNREQIQTTSCEKSAVSRPEAKSDWFPDHVTSLDDNFVCDVECQQDTVSKLFIATGEDAKALSRTDDAHIQELADYLVNDVVALQAFSDDYIAQLAGDFEVDPWLEAKIDYISEALPEDIRNEMAQQALDHPGMDTVYVLSRFSDADEVTQRMLEESITNIDKGGVKNIYLLQSLVDGYMLDSPTLSQDRSRVLNVLSNHYASTSNIEEKVAAMKGAAIFVEEPKELEGIYNEALSSGDDSIVEAAITSATMSGTEYLIKNNYTDKRRPQLYSNALTSRIKDIANDLDQSVEIRYAAMNYIMETQ